MRRLYLHNLDEDFDIAHDVALGPWCFLGVEECYPHWEEYCFPIDVLSGGDILREALAVRRLMNEQVVICGEKLNRCHGTDHDSGYWRFLLVPWLLGLLQAARVAYLQVCSVVDSFQDEPIVVRLMPQEMDWCFADTLDFIQRGISRRVFFYWLHSIFMRRLAPDNWVLETDNKSSAILATSRDVDRQKPNRFKQWLVNRYRGMRFFGVDGVPMFWVLFFSVFLSWYRSNRTRPAPFSKAVDADAAELTDSFLNVIPVLITATLPESIGKDYPLLERQVAKRRFKPGSIRIFGSSLWYDDEKKAEAARCWEVGETIVATQHGGNYGIANSHPDPAEIEYVQDSFFSWGWSKITSHPGNITPLPSPFLSAIQNAHRSQNSHLILVGTQQRIFSWRLDSTPRPTQWVSARHDKVTFYDNLTSEVQSNFFYRPSPDDLETMLDDALYMRRFISGLSLVDGPLTPQILGCRLLVIDHPGTTLNIAMAANIPVICIWPSDHYHICPEAHSLFELMRDIGILFEDPAEAAIQVSRIWSNVEEWWQNERRQMVCQDFCKRYARVDRFWWKHWLRALVEL